VLETLEAYSKKLPNCFSAKTRSSRRLEKVSFQYFRLPKGGQNDNYSTSYLAKGTYKIWAEHSFLFFLFILEICYILFTPSIFVHQQSFPLLFFTLLFSSYNLFLFPSRSCALYLYRSLLLSSYSCKVCLSLFILTYSTCSTVPLLCSYYFILSILSL